LELAEFFGVARESVKEWRRSGLPGSPQRYDLSEVAQWLIERMRRRKGSAEPRSPAAQYELVRARILRLKYMRARGELVHRDAHEALVLRLLAAIKDKLERAAREISELGEGMDRHDLLAQARQQFDKLLGELAEFGGAEIDEAGA